MKTAQQRIENEQKDLNTKRFLGGLNFQETEEEQKGIISRCKVEFGKSLCVA